MKPHMSRMLVHPKDKHTPQENAVWCTRSHVRIVHRGDGEKVWGERKEHKRDVKTLEEKKYTRSRKKDSLTEVYPSAIMDHVVKENHTIDWEGVKFPNRDTDWTAGGVKAVEIRKTGAHAMNRDRGCHQLSSVHS